ncbi:hypothetical protein, partial [Rhodoplanes roseus]
MAEDVVAIREGATAGQAARAPTAPAPTWASLPAPLRRACLGWGLAIMAGLVAAPPLVAGLQHYGLPQFYLIRHDMLWLAVTAALLLGFAVVRLPAGRVGRLPALRLDVTAWSAAALVVTIAAAGALLALRGFALSRDETMADFDAAILRSGRLAAALPPDWRALREALIPEFLLPVPGGTVWLSNYLPGNAALRALVGLVADPAWTSPLLAGVAVLAAWRCARKLWPDRPDAGIVAIVMLAGSTQVLVTAMTAYAMTAHLALDLVWLALYLRDDRRGHLGAVAVGALACGLHQIVFHPLFVAPFVLHLVARRRIGLALVYAGSYAVICAFWIGYWQIVLASQGIARSGEVGAGFLGQRVVAFLADLGPDNLTLMIANALRFAGWQPLLLLPLAGLAWGAVRRDESVARPLAGGLVLTFAAMLILVPHQGHGWGYRYLHGLIGNACLLAGWGWIAATARAAPGERRAAVLAVTATTVLALAVALPLRLVQATVMIAPYRGAMAAIAATGADLVMVDRTGIAFGHDLVRNDPDLRGRPLVLDLGAVDPDTLAALCRRHRIAVFDRKTADACRTGRTPCGSASPSTWPSTPRRHPP